MPLPPFLLQPAWRYGEQTPWGGSRLKELFHKDPPGPCAGESLELSAIPGLQSRDSRGRALGELMEEHGQSLTGTAVKGTFPLLLKLLDAREKLSVQVHPDDEAAGSRHGKLGKSEAWVILACGPGAELICGVRESVTLGQLREASLSGAAVESLLRHVPVSPGETYYIPPGTVHAIGAGIVLYEIQQSSDVTYRLYDWGRVDREGKRRELHLEESLAVIDLASRPEPARPFILPVMGNGRRERLLANPYFGLERLQCCQGLVLQPDRARFGVLTAISSCTLLWDGGVQKLEKGSTALLPADGYPLSFTGQEALMAFPSV